jgi:hypothetical protein
MRFDGIATKAPVLMVPLTATSMGIAHMLLGGKRWRLRPVFGRHEQPPQASHLNSLSAAFSTK